MVQPIGYQTMGVWKRRPSRWPVIIAVTIALAVVLSPLVVIFLMGRAFGGNSKIDPTSKTLTPAETGNLVAQTLMEWGVFGKYERRNEYDSVLDTLTSGTRGINGFTQSDGFHGDGTDWYEVELTPYLATQLRIYLKKTPRVQKSNYWPTGTSAPPWWPRQGPPDCECYERGTEYFVLAATGTRAWFMRLRT